MVKIQFVVTLVVMSSMLLPLARMIYQNLVNGSRAGIWRYMDERRGPVEVH